MLIKGTDGTIYKNYTSLAAELGVTSGEVKNICAEAAPYNDVFYNVYTTEGLRNPLALCWDCENADGLLCKWFNPDNPKLPKGAKVYTWECYQRKKPQNLHIVIMCPDFKPEKGFEFLMIKNCFNCDDPTKAEVQVTGKETFGKTKSHYVCRNYECRAFSENHLYPGETMPEKPKTEEEPKKPKKPKKPASAKAKTTAKTKKDNTSKK